MATTIKLKNGSGAPLAGDLVQGEPAFDLTNKRLYTEDSGGSVIEVGTNPTSLTTGTFTSTGIDDNATSTAITIDSSENVGIGTVSPSYKADIAGTLNAQGLQVKGSSSLSFNASNWMTQQETGVARTYICGPDASTYQPWEIYRATSTGGASLTMKLDESGNVGIGTTSPSSQNSVFKEVIGSSSDSNSGSVLVSSSTGSGWLGWNDAESATIPAYIKYDHSTNSMQFQANSAERMRIDSSGNVGIGTTSPIAKLNVEDTSGDDNGFYVFKNGRSSSKNYSSADMSASSICWIQAQENNTSLANTLVMRQYDAAVAISALYNTTNTGSLAFGTNNGSASVVERMRIDSSGNVGIGTTSPSVASGSGLVVYDSSASRVTLRNATSGDASTDGGGLVLSGADLYLEQRESANLILSTSATERMRIDSSGHVGIGTSSPGSYNALGSSKHFVVSSGNTTTMTIHSGTTNYGHLAFADGTASVNDQYRGLIQYYHTENSMRLYTNAAERMRIDSSGNLIVGNTSVDATSSVSLKNEGSIRSIYASGVGGDSLFGGISGVSNGYQIVADASNNQTYKWHNGGTQSMTLDSSGNLLVGTTSTSFRGNHTIASDSAFSASVVQTKTSAGASVLNLDFSGATPNSTSDYFIYAEDASAVRLVVYSNGNVANVNNSYGAYSDSRLKSNIVDASSQIDDIMAVQVRSYTLDSTGDTHIGVVAQELEASGMSGLVEEDEEGIKSVKYSVLYMKAIKALQEAVTRIETLEAEVAALKGA